jgi:hypothetical protein
MCDGYLTLMELRTLELFTRKGEKLNPLLTQMQIGAWMLMVENLFLDTFSRWPAGTMTMFAPSLHKLSKILPKKGREERRKRDFYNTTLQWPTLPLCIPQNMAIFFLIYEISEIFQKSKISKGLNCWS